MPTQTLWHTVCMTKDMCQLKAIMSNAETTTDNANANRVKHVNIKKTELLND